MSTFVPFDTQVEIIKRVLSVKSLIRFRSVSKQWKSLIDSSKFITDHSVNQAHPHHILVRYESFHVDSERGYVSILDDDSFPMHKFSPSVTPTVNLLNGPLISFSSHGLVCLYAYRGDKKNLIVVWNPSIRKSVGVELSYEPNAVGFGVCPKTNDLKIVTVLFTGNWIGKVSTLGCGGWRSISVNLDLPNSPTFKPDQVVIDGVIYWVVYNGTLRNMIISFDLESEEFGEVELPNGLARPRIELTVFKRKDSLAMVTYDFPALDLDVWMMRKIDGAKYLCTKVYTYKWAAMDNMAGIMGFRKNGEPIRQRVYYTDDDINEDDDGIGTRLEAYEPYAERITKLGVGSEEGCYLFTVTSYTESLFLLNQPESIIQ